MKMNTKLLEDKLQHCQESLNFVSRELLRFKDSRKSRFTTMDTVYYWESVPLSFYGNYCDYHYKKGRPIEIDRSYEQIRYLVRYENGKSDWHDENLLFASREEMIAFLKDRIAKLVINPSEKINRLNPS